MSEEDLIALKAAELYSGDSTFRDIATELGVSNSYAQVLVKRGIDLVFQEMGNRNPGGVVEENPGAHSDLETVPPPPQYIFPPQDPRTGTYTLDTDGIGRRVLLTPKAIMIFDLWRGSGFSGDLSDFIEDSINFMYDTRRPIER